MEGRSPSSMSTGMTLYSQFVFVTLTAQELQYSEFVKILRFCMHIINS